LRDSVFDFKNVETRLLKWKVRLDSVGTDTEGFLSKRHHQRDRRQGRLFLIRYIDRIMYPRLNLCVIDGFSLGCGVYAAIFD